jgi:hypothetical protein
LVCIQPFIIWSYEIGRRRRRKERGEEHRTRALFYASVQ